MTDRTDLGDLVRRLAVPGGRRIVAVVGAPGSGKSTLCDALEARLGAAGTRAATVPMDGFHYDDGVLGALGLLPRKGAPETFDVGGLAATLARLRAAEAPWTAVPLFDRGLEIARAGARLVRPEVEVVLVEGNYLLLDEPPWDALPPFDLTIRIEVPEAELRRRLEARWADLPPEEARRKVEENDVPNGRRADVRSRPADLALSFDA
jgi:pantothenate kinase